MYTYSQHNISNMLKIMTDFVPTTLGSEIKKKKQITVTI